MKKLISLLIIIAALPWMQGCGKQVDADSTVGKAMSATFQDHLSRTNCTLSKFTTKTKKDEAVIAQSWVFRNSTSYITATTIPASAGRYNTEVFYNNTSEGVFGPETVRAHDADDNNTAIGSPIQTGTAVALASSQPNYAPAKAGDAMAVTGDFSATMKSSLNASTPASSPGGGSVNVNFLPFIGTNGYASPVSNGMPIALYTGDDVVIPYAITQPGATPTAKRPPLGLTGYTVRMAIKRNASDTAYIVAPRDITAQVNAPKSLGTGVINLAHADTLKLSGQYSMQIVLYSGGGLQNVGATFVVTANPRVISP